MEELELFNQAKNFSHRNMSGILRTTRICFLSQCCIYDNWTQYIKPFRHTRILNWTRTHTHGQIKNCRKTCFVTRLILLSLVNLTWVSSLKVAEHPLILLSWNTKGSQLSKVEMRWYENVFVLEVLFGKYFWELHFFLIWRFTRKSNKINCKTLYWCLVSWNCR